MSKIAAAALLSLISGSLAAQSPAPAYIVTRLGVDTVAIERYTRSNGKLEGDQVLRNPRLRVIHYVAELGPRGEVKSLTAVVRPPSADPKAPALTQIVSKFGDSIAVFDVTRNGQADTSLTGQKVFHGTVQPTFFTEPAAYGLYEQTLSSANLGRDSVVYALVGPGGGGAVPVIVLRRRGADSVAFTSSWFPGWTEVARVDSRGRITGMNATATTVKTIAERVPALDFDKVVKGWAAIEAAKGVTGQMSPPDTVKASVGGANIQVAYSRPLKRGRVIFGNVVPWNQVWRTGANAATQLTTDKALVFGATVVPAGKYTLWTLPTPTGAKLIINSETGQWGTAYHADKDFARLDLTSNLLSTPVEQFVIAVQPQGSGGVLRLAWDNQEYLIPFTVK